jgi:recombination protein RecA
LIDKRGSFYSYGDIRLGQGRENAKSFLRENSEMTEEIDLAIRQQALSGLMPMAVGDEDEPESVEEEE